ncbi:dihydrolipoamide acetyltransferase family protein [Brevibacillus daliensis]|uniref:dihydrolipoamide acetyltransferase family protein n=1 Tax=Brevibacillus daliensis TaxID=2892995 RepID=UPI001E43362B|nr:dihydrolipoamide acetyltransferase family protein [Brevibacillus daliensis]
MVEFKLPDVGEGMHEGEILQMLVKVGENVKQDQPILEVQTDKVNAELTSPVTGIIKQIFFFEGDTVEVGTTLLVIDPDSITGSESGKQVNQTKSTDNSKESVSNHVRNDSASNRIVPSKMESSEQASITNQSHSAARKSRRVMATPYVRQLAREMQIDIEQVKGTGPAGRVTEEDVRNYGKDEALVSISQVSATEEIGKIRTTSQKATPSIKQERETRYHLKGIRKKIAEHMVKSVSIIPHVTSVDEIEMDKLVEVRENLKPFAQKRGIKLTYLPFVIKALVITLKEFPTFNASIDDETNEVVLKNYYNMGIATDTPNGLIVPVIRDADQKSMFQLAEEISSFAQLARDGKLSLDQITGGTFTVSNVGPIGGLQATPIINHPEVAIISLHKVEKRMVVREDQAVIRQMMNISLSFDHRLIDGVTAVKFTNRIKELLENPNLLLAEMV